MSLDDAVRKRGFRRWYERQLVESHAYLVTGLLSLIMMAIALEVIQFRESISNAILLIAIAVGGALLSIFAWKEFSRLLFRAESLANQATCSACREYARFDIVDARDSSEALTGRVLSVRCRKCQHQWQMG
ncbi:MAG TPA: hypothetical protein VNE58_04980 [Casimicrobiaceae bacterium]|nr:hypothetical protein [Casimicrobiaceae bacterium]